MFVFAQYTYNHNGVIHFREGAFTQSDIRFNENELLPWLKTIAEHNSLKKNLVLIQTQYVDLARRLNILYQEREKIVRDFGKESYAKPIDENIQNLSALGLRLSTVAKKLIPKLEPLLAKIRINQALGKGLEGLRSYEKQLDNASNIPNNSLEDVTASLEQAIKELEKAINQ